MTSPTSVAVGATKAVGCTSGAFPSNSNSGMPTSRRRSGERRTGARDALVDRLAGSEGRVGDDVPHRSQRARPLFHPSAATPRATIVVMTLVDLEPGDPRLETDVLPVLQELRPH